MKKLFVMLALLVLTFVLPLKANAHETAEGETLVYKIFVHEDCPHCLNVKKFVTENDLEHHVEYIELKNNDANMALLEDYWSDFGIEGTVGWPMMIIDEDTKKYEIGDTPIIAFLAEQNGIEVTDSSTTDGTTTDSAGSSAGDKIFFGIGGLFLVSVLGYAVYSALKSDKK